MSGEERDVLTNGASRQDRSANPVRSSFVTDSIRTRRIPPAETTVSRHHVNHGSRYLVARSRTDDIRDDLDELRRAQVSVLRRITELSRKVDATSVQVATENALATVAKTRTIESILHRVILFAGMNAAKVLCSPHPDLSRHVTNLCPGNSVSQVTLKSKGSDCTLEEFRIFTTSCSHNSMFQCTVFPSEFYTFFSDTSKCSRLEIAFETYFGICEALRLNVDIRESGTYREKKNSARELRSVQVIGVDAVDLEEVPVRGRRILLGRSMPSSSTPFVCPSLYQKTLSWRENSWEVGFEYRTDAVDSSSLRSNGRHHEIRTSDINMPPIEENTFRVTWERSSAGTNHPQTPAEMIPGTLRSFFPAVIIRSRILTTTARNVFLSRIDGVLLNQIIVSPAGDREERES